MKAVLLLLVALLGCLVALIVFLLHSMPDLQWLLLMVLVLACVYFATDDGQASQDDV